MLVRPHSKVVLREAIKTDSDFLSKSNIMDYSCVLQPLPRYIFGLTQLCILYSLLLGVDEEHKQIACGLVDTIGACPFLDPLLYQSFSRVISNSMLPLILRKLHFREDIGVQGEARPAVGQGRNRHSSGRISGALRQRNQQIFLGLSRLVSA
jgi:hypothetical protein